MIYKLLKGGFYMYRKTREIIFDPETANNVLLGKTESSSFMPKILSSKDEIFLSEEDSLISAEELSKIVRPINYWICII